MKKTVLVFCMLLLVAAGAQAQNSSLLFNGSQQVVADPANLNNSNAFTIDFWTYIDATSVGGMVLQTSTLGTPTLALGFSNVPGSESIMLYCMGSSATQVHAFPVGTWFNVAVTYDGATNTGELFIDGISIVSIGGTIPAPFLADDLFLGYMPIAGMGFTGNLAEFRIWDSVLTDVEIQAVMGSASNGLEAGLLQLYHFDEGAGQDVNDSAGSNEAGTLGTDPAGADAADPTWSTDGPPIAGPVGFAGHYYRGWSLISFPMDLDPGQTIEYVFSDDIIGLYQVIGFEMDMGYYFPTEVENGEAYWLAIAFMEDAYVDADGDPWVGDYTVDLDWGWNMIGYPFHQSSDIYDWYVEWNGNTFTMAQAEAYNLIVPLLHTSYAPGNWDPAQDPAGPWIPFFQGTTAEPWYGYWLLTLMDEEITLVIPEPTMAATNTTDEVNEENWRVSLLARSGDAFSGVSFGARADATNGYDFKYDSPAAPGAPEGDLQLYFDRSAWDTGLEAEFASDMVAPLSAVHEFQLQLEGEGEIELRWSDLAATAPEGYGFELLAGGQSYDMQDVEIVTLSGVEEVTVLVTPDATDVDESAEGEIPSRFALEAAYPNPFNPSTTIAYSLPRAATVRLTVTDVLGRTVGELVNGSVDAGRHEVTWNAQDLASGVYFVHLRANGVQQMQKIVLMK